MSEATRGRVRVEEGRKHVRVYLGGQLVADTKRPHMVWESPHYPQYYIPAEDVKAQLSATGKTERSPSRGEAELFDVVVDGKSAESAARRYPDSPIEELRGLVRFDFDAMSQWFEENEPIAVHARDPYTRIDILGSSRHIRVEIDGVTVADSHQPRILFETGLRPRYYLPLTDVRMDLLRPSDTETHCPYKGTANYYSVDTGTAVHEDVVWYYKTPLPESQKIIGLVAFYNEKLDIYVDGELEPRKLAS